MASILTQTFKSEGKQKAQELILNEFNKRGTLHLTANALDITDGTLSYWLYKLNMRLVTTLIVDNEPNIIETVYLPTNSPEVAEVG